MKQLLLCADDYGLSSGIDSAILALAAARRLTHCSCIVNTPGWPAAAAALAGSGLHSGWHLNLTEGRPLSPTLAALWPQLPALPRLIMLAHLRRLPLAALRDELQRQLAAFEQARGAPPTHLDGHQHVHHLPQIRALVLELLATRPGLSVRHTGRVVGPGFALKRALIAGTGGRSFGQRLLALGRAQNRCLAGVYDFNTLDYRRLMQGWLAALPAEGGLIFCHPGTGGVASAADAIAAARARELAYLGGPAFVDDLAAAGVALAHEGPAAVDGEGQQRRH